MRFPLLGRFALVAGVALALLLPLSMIRDKVSERRDLADAVQKAFADQTSGAQAIAGPFLAPTCALASVMLLTRRLDWGALSRGLRQPLADPA